MPRLPRPRLPRLPRLRLPRPRLPSPPDAVLDVGRIPLEAGRAGWDRWLDLSIYMRRRLGVGAGVLGAIALIWLLAVPALPCEAPGGEVCAPADDAIGLVPDDALAYVHLNLDRGSDQFAKAEGMASQIPALAQQGIGLLVARLPAPGGGSADFDRDIRPWFANEAALAILPAGGRVAQQVELLEVSDTAGALNYADSIHGGQLRTSQDRGIEVQTDRRGLATALVGGFLAIGTKTGVRAVIDAESGANGARSLADDPAASTTRSALPDQRLLDLYLSRPGVKRLVANPSAPFATLAAVVDPRASVGVAAALVAAEGALSLDIRSALDPARAAAHPGVFSSLPSFRPTLPASLAPDSLGYVGIGNPVQTIGGLVQLARTREPGLAALAQLSKRFRALGKVDLGHDLLPLLGGEAALALDPPAGGARTPILVLVGAGLDASHAPGALARLQRPLAKALSPSQKAASFKRQRVGGVSAYSLRLSGTVNLTYAIVDSKLVIATDPAGIRSVATGSGLGDADAFRQATAGLPSDVSALGYLNLGGLVALAERAGLASNPAYPAFAADLQTLQALSVAVQRTTQELSTDVRLIVG